MKHPSMSALLFHYSHTNTPSQRHTPSTPKTHASCPLPAPPCHAPSPCCYKYFPILYTFPPLYVTQVVRCSILMIEIIPAHSSPSSFFSSLCWLIIARSWLTLITSCCIVTPGRRHGKEKASSESRPFGTPRVPRKVRGKGLGIRGFQIINLLFLNSSFFVFSFFVKAS